MSLENCSDAAVMRGYTREVIITGGFSEFTALIKPDTDLDDRFKAFDIDNREWLFVNGWNCDINDVEGN